MTDDPKTADDSVSHAQRIDQLCDAFESAWNSGQRPKLEDALAQVSPTEQDQLLRELLPIEIFHRVKCGEQPSKSDYSARFPGLDSAWIEQVIAQRAPQLTAALQAGFRPDVIIAGRYVLKQKLGEGGMGEVWVAKQTDPVKRNVALKLIKTGMDSRTVLARFEAERQAFALMDHPHIARVLDGGITGSGQPFFVMELVNGLPLNKFCDEAKLTLQQRLELFVPICQAVQHAHHKGIVHRDLKPSNILVTLIDGRPVPKVIDFGVAKATAGKLTDESIETQFGAVVGTLEYMSPEQAGCSGDDIDTRADIYSLGVILYELLTGLRPMDAKRLKKAAYAEMIRIIKEEEPSKPSTRLSTDESLPSLAALRQTEPRTLMAVLRGELDWVVMKCLEKDRNRRYETAVGLARDIERYLAEQPIEARPPSTTYRLRKFMMRNKRPVVAASLLVLALVGGIVGTTWGLVRAKQQQVLAEQATIEERHARKAEEEQRSRADTEAMRAKAKAEEAFENAKGERVQRERADAEYKLARRHLYVAHMNMAQSAWDASNLGMARELLEKQRPTRGDDDLRGFEWYYWDRLCHSYLLELKGHTSTTSSAVFSPDGKRLATASHDATVKVWDAGTGQLFLTLKGHTCAVNCVAFSPDGGRVASISVDQTVKMWDAATGQELLTLQGHTRPLTAAGKPQFSPSSLAFSPDGKRLASTRDHVIKIWDISTGLELLMLRGHTNSVASVAFSPDGKRLASVSWDKTLKLWDALTGEELLTVNGYDGTIANVAFSLDGQRLASASAGKKITVRNAVTGDALLTLNESSAGNSVAFSPDGKRLATASDKTIKMWDVFTGQQLFTLKGHAAGIFGVAFSADGKRLASTGHDQTVKVWDSNRTQEPVTLKGHLDWALTSVAFSPDGKRLASASADRTVKIWDVASGQDMITLKHPHSVMNLAFSPDGKRLASVGGKSVVIWDVEMGRQSLTLEGHTRGVMGVAFSPDGKRLASASSDQTVKVWDAPTGEELFTLSGHTKWVTSVAFSPNGQWLASASGDQCLKLWDAATGQELLSLNGHTGTINCVAFSPDGKWLASASSDLTVKIWDTSTGRELITLKGHTGIVSSVVFSSDGDRLASASWDETIKLWDAATFETLLTMKGHIGAVNSVAFSSDGQHLASAGWTDRTIKLWDATPKKQGPPTQALESDRSR